MFYAFQNGFCRNAWAATGRGRRGGLHKHAGGSGGGGGDSRHPSQLSLAGLSSRARLGRRSRGTEKTLEPQVSTRLVFVFHPSSPTKTRFTPFTRFTRFTPFTPLTRFYCLTQAS